MNSPHSVRSHVRFACPTVIRWSLAVCGSALLVVGVSLPTVAIRDESGQLVATQSYFDDASGDASVVVVLAALVFAANISTRQTWLRIAGAAALGFVALGFASELFSGNAIHTRSMFTYGVAWGWAVLWIGALLAALAGWFVDARADSVAAR